MKRNEIIQVALYAGLLLLALALAFAGGFLERRAAASRPYDFCLWSPVSGEIGRVTGRELLIAGDADPIVIYLCADGLPEEYADKAREILAASKGNK